MNKKNPCCVFDTSSTIDFATECFKIFLPMEFGFVNFNIVHSLRREIVSDVWRLGMAYAYDDALEKNYLLTRFNAEWDMAIHLFGRDDFIGGSNHGDEVYYSASLFIDGVRRDIRRITELTEFENLVFRTESVGYDPDDHVTKVLLHKKEFRVDKDGITTEQSVEWLTDRDVDNSYLAMMPPLKTMTDSFYFDLDPQVRDIKCGFAEDGVHSATLFGKESGVYYTMTVGDYPEFGKSRFIITDNGGSPYNKMYFLACKRADVKVGDVWHSVTRHEIKLTKSIHGLGD